MAGTAFRIAVDPMMVSPNEALTAGLNEVLMMVSPNEALRAGLIEAQRAGLSEVRKVCRNAVGPMTVFPNAAARRVALNEVRRAALNEVRKVFRNVMVRMTVFPNVAVRRAALIEILKDVHMSPDAVLHADRDGRLIVSLLGPAIWNLAASKGASTRTDEPPEIPNSWVWGRIAYRVCYPGGHQIWSFSALKPLAAHRTALTGVLKSQGWLREIPNLWVEPRASPRALSQSR